MKYLLKISNLFVFMFLHRLILFYTLYITILKYQGFAPIIISLTMVLHECGKLIADTHTGAMADKYGIRKIMAIGLCIKAFGIMLWIFEVNILLYFVGMFLLGVGRSCTVGGKIETYTYNMLFSLKKDHIFQDIWLGMLMIDGLAATLSGWLAGFLYTIGGFNLGLIFSVFIILVIHVPFVIFVMPDPVMSIRKTTTKLSINDIIKSAIRLIKQDNSIFLLIIGTALVPSLFIILGKFKLFICNDIGLPVFQIANIDSLSHFLQFLCTPIFLILLKKYKYQLTFLNNLYLVALSLLILILANFWYKMSVIYAIMFFVTIYPIISSSIKYSLEKTLPSDIRATISSITSFVYSIFNTIFLLAIGIIAQFFSYQISLFVVSAFCLITILILIKYQKNI